MGTGPAAMSAGACDEERHLFLSPHYDDIALSCGGTAALLNSRGHRPEIALIFGDMPDLENPLTPFAEDMHREWGMNREEVIDARRGEESKALAIIGATEHTLPFSDAIYRGVRYQSDAELFGNVAVDEEMLPARIADALGLTDRDRQQTSIYAPLGIGRHIDHQIAFGTGMLLGERGFTVRWYEDLPYALDPANVTRRMEELSGLVEPAESVAISEVWETKIDAIMAYPSQHYLIFRRFVGVEPTRASISEAMLGYAESVGDGIAVERFWKRIGDRA